MTTEDFVKECYEGKENYLKKCFCDNSKLEASELINRLSLDENKKDILYKLIDTVLTDTYFTILLTLDGCTSISSLMQQSYTVLDEKKNIIIDGSGETEAITYKYFYEK